MVVRREEEKEEGRRRRKRWWWSWWWCEGGEEKERAEEEEEKVGEESQAEQLQLVSPLVFLLQPCGYRTPPRGLPAAGRDQRLGTGAARQCPRALAGSATEGLTGSRDGVLWEPLADATTTVCVPCFAQCICLFV